MNSNSYCAPSVTCYLPLAGKGCKAGGGGGVEGFAQSPAPPHPPQSPQSWGEGGCIRFSGLKMMAEENDRGGMVWFRAHPARCGEVWSCYWQHGPGTRRPWVVLGQAQGLPLQTSVHGHLLRRWGLGSDASRARVHGRPFSRFRHSLAAM